MFPPARPLAAGIAALGLGLGVPAGAAEAAADSAAAGGLTITPPSLLVPADPAGPASAPTTHEKIRQLEQQVQRMAADARAQQEVVRTLRRRLATAESASQWVPLFGTALGALIIVSGYLGLQLHRVSVQRRREREQARLQRLVDAHDDAVPGVRSPAPIAATAALVRTTAPQRAEPPAAAPQEVTAALEPTQHGIGTAAPRAVSVEEMLDLEQQADFFLALGQDEAAIDLLMGHIRASGGASPLPYLKLLEIYRRRGDETSFERTRNRFNLRFNAVVPAFADDLERGRDLEHYPQVMRRVQKIWAYPLDALAELESLLYRHDGAEPFDLPAYRDLLLLAAVANDLRAAVGGPVTSVDLLLPLGEGAVEPSQTVRRALASRLAGTQAMAPELTSHLLGRRDDDRRGETVDLDLSDVATAPREFTRPAAFSDVEMRDDRHPTELGALDRLDPSAHPRRR